MFYLYTDWIYAQYHRTDTVFKLYRTEFLGNDFLYFPLHYDIYLLEEYWHHCDGHVFVHVGRRGNLYWNMAEFSQSRNTKIFRLAQSIILLDEYGYFSAGIRTNQGNYCIFYFWFILFAALVCYTCQKTGI